LAEHAPAWWAAVQQTLAEHNAASPLLDPLGEAAGPRDAPRALLQAALHLLAWAKTRWAELANYGLADRLRFCGTGARAAGWAAPLAHTPCGLFSAAELR